MKSFFALSAFIVLISFATLALAEEDSFVEGSSATTQLNKEAKAELIIPGLSGKETDHASITGQGIVKNYLQGCDTTCQNCYNVCRFSGTSKTICARLCGKTLKNEIDGDVNEEYPKGEMEEVIFKHEEVIIKRPRKQMQ